MSKIIGSFFYRDENDGCLLSKYINTGLTSPLVESVKRLSADPNNPKDPFLGTFDSVYLDDGAHRAALTIHKENTDEEKYHLKWTLNNKLVFIGEGMICNGFLVGAYWSV